MAQNGTYNKSGLPHGMVPFHQIPDPQTRDAVMKLNENIVALAKRPYGGGGENNLANINAAELLASIEANYPNAAAAAAAISQVTASASAASDSAVAAAGSALAAAGSADDADDSADEAAGYALAAAASADRVASYEWSTSFAIVNTALTYSGNNGANVDCFLVSAFVPDASANARYTVTATFCNTTAITSGTRYFKLSRDTSSSSSSDTVEDSLSDTIPAAANPANVNGPSDATKVLSLELSGSDSFYMLNGGTSQTAASGAAQWTVFVKIAKLPQASANTGS